MAVLSHDGGADRQAVWSTMFRRIRQGDLGPLPVIIGLLIIAVVFQNLNANFLTPRNISNLIVQIGVVGTLGSGVVFVLLLGEIDLSLGAVSGVAASILAIALSSYGLPGWLAIATAILSGLAMGALQGLVVVFLRVPSFIATLAGLLAWQGVQLIILGSQGERLIRDPLVRSIASDYMSPTAGYILAAVVMLAVIAMVWHGHVVRRRAGLPTKSATAAFVKIGVLAIALGAATAALNAYFGVPYIVPVLGGVVLALTWFTERTMTGRHIYAIGGNAEAARRAGIPVAAIKIGVFSLCGGLAGWGGVISASRQFAVSIGTGGGTLLLDAIAAAVIGGTSLFGGRGRMYNAVLGALVIGSVANGLNLLGSPSSIENIATGAILVVAVAIDAMSRAGQQSR